MRLPVVSMMAAFVVALGALPALASTGRPVQTERIQVVPEEVIEMPSGVIVPDQPPPSQSVEPPGEPTDVSGLPEIHRDLAGLPEKVRSLRERIIAAAKTGDLEKLRPIIEETEEPPVFSFSPIDDPIAFLADSSGDAEGREILAILLEVLEAGYVHVDVGTEEEMYVWPYFSRYPIDALTPEQMVEIFTLLTAGDFEDMKSFGAYIFYRVGIDPNGTWHFFVAGD
jgi:hypothetical protein